MERRLELNPAMITSHLQYRQRGIQLLRDYRSSNGLLHDIAIYFPGHIPGTLFSAQHGELSIRTFIAPRSGTTDTITVDEFYSLLDSISVQSHFRITQQGQLANAINLILIASPLPSGVSNPHGYALFYIMESTLSGILGNPFIGNQGLMRVYDRYGLELVSFSSLEHSFHITTEELMALTANGVSSKEIRVDNVRYTVIASMGPSGFTYLMAVSSTQLFRPVYTNLLLFLLAIGGAFLFGVLLSFLLAKHNIKLLNALMYLLPSRTESKLGRDEYLDVKTSIQSLSLEHTALVTRSKEQEDVAREHFLLLLISSYRFDTPEFKKIEDFSGIVLPYPNHLIILLRIVNYDDFTSGKSIHTQSLYLFGICNVIEEILSHNRRAYTFIPFSRRNIAVLLNYKGYTRGEIESAVQACIDFSWEHFNIALTAGVGSECAGYEAVGRSFFEALRVVMRRHPNTERSVYFFGESEIEETIKNAYPIELEQEIINCIRSGDPHVAVDATKRFIAHVTLISTARNVLYEHYFSLIDNIIGNIAEPFPQLTKQLYSESMDLLSKAWTNSFEVELTEVITNAADKVSKLRHDDKQDFVKRVTVYVDTHCYEQTLSINEIADHFDFTPSYLTRLFRTYTGYTLKNYIDKNRMKEAKRLLAESNKTLKEIVAEIGYVDESSFIRKFKSTEKMTPAQFRIASKQ